LEGRLRIASFSFFIICGADEQNIEEIRMPRKLKLIYKETGVTAIAEMLEDEAPKTCEAMWNALATPMETKGIHAMFCGREIMLTMPEANKTQELKEVPGENQTIYPAPGDLAWRYFGPHEERGFSDEIYDFMIFYGRECRIDLPLGKVPVNIFATITEHLAEFAKCCEKVRTEGIKDFIVMRVEE
jgi:hypothetical protein